LKSNLLEASPEMMQRDGEKEWYYGNKEKERLGPFSFKEVSNTTSILVWPCLSLSLHACVQIGSGEYNCNPAME